VRLGRETSMHYFSYLGGPGVVSIKKHVETCYAELVLLHPGGFAGLVVHSGATGV
jgi:hypothetical protein